MPNFFDKLKKTNPVLHNQIIDSMKTGSIRSTAYRFAPILGMKPDSLKMTLQRNNKKLGIKNPPSELSKTEVDFLERFKRGEVQFEEAQRELAYRVFKKILEEPEQLKAADWLRSELVKIKREEISMKKEQMDLAWTMIFGSFMIPKVCPHCGGDLQPKAYQKLEILKGEDAPLKQDNHDSQPMAAV